MTSPARSRSRCGHGSTSDAPAGSLTNNATATSDDAGRAKADATIKVPAKHGVKGKLKRTAGVTG